MKTCRYCGESGLVWNQFEGGWRLHKNKQLHECQEFLIAHPTTSFLLMTPHDIYSKLHDAMIFVTIVIFTYKYFN